MFNSRFGICSLCVLFLSRSLLCGCYFGRMTDIRLADLLWHKAHSCLYLMDSLSIIYYRPNVRFPICIVVPCFPCMHLPVLRLQRPPRRPMTCTPMNGDLSVLCYCTWLANTGETESWRLLWALSCTVLMYTLLLLFITLAATIPESVM